MRSLRIVVLLLLPPAVLACGGRTDEAPPTTPIDDAGLEAEAVACTPVSGTSLGYLGLREVWGVLQPGIGGPAQDRLAFAFRDAPATSADLVVDLALQGTLDQCDYCVLVAEDSPAPGVMLQHLEPSSAARWYLARSGTLTVHQYQTWGMSQVDSGEIELQEVHVWKTSEQSPADSGVIEVWHSSPVAEGKCLRLAPLQWNLVVP